MTSWTPIGQVIQAFRDGRMVVIADAETRENEGDLALATAAVTPAALAFMTREARGLICVSISKERAEKLKIQYQTDNNNSAFGTPFGISLDHSSVVSTGVTAEARAQTLRRMVAADACPEEFQRPGHVFPLIANPAGVIGRQGQTEGSYDLARIAGFEPSGVICEILLADGTMARGQALFDFAKVHDLPITNVEEILRYRLAQEVLVRLVGQGPFNTDFGNFQAFAFENDADGREHLALVYGKLDTDKAVLTRVHSECLTGDVFGSLRCDCGEQLHRSLEAIVKNGNGVLIYLRQEGRGIGLLNKLRAYELQDRGQDTVQANLTLGFEADARDFVVAARMLATLGVRQVDLLTNNPRKIEMITSAGMQVASRKPLLVEPNEHSMVYLETKRAKLGHLFQA